MNVWWWRKYVDWFVLFAWLLARTCLPVCIVCMKAMLILAERQFSSKSFTKNIEKFFIKCWNWSFNIVYQKLLRGFPVIFTKYGTLHKTMLINVQLKVQDLIDSIKKLKAKRILNQNSKKKHLKYSTENDFLSFTRERFNFIFDSI